MKFIFLLLAVLLFFGGLILNAGYQALRSLRAWFPKIKTSVFSLCYASAVGILFLLFFFSRTLPGEAWTAGTWYAVGFFVYFLMIFNLLSLVSLFEKILPRCTHLCPVAGIAATLLLFTVFLYGAVHAQTLKTKEYTVSLGDGATPMKAILISDLHLGSTVGEKRLSKIRDVVIQEQPDLLLIAGDVFDGDFSAVKNPERLQELFREMAPPMGIYACLGNHDAGKTLPEMLSFLEKAGITLLADEAIELENGTVLAGRRDSSPIGSGNGARRPLVLPETDAPVILLDHQPANLEEYGSEIDLLLCGHTHKGQIFPIGFITNAMFEVDYGYDRRSPDSPQVVVSSGVGFWGPPLRVASDCEIVLLNLTP